VLACVGCSYSDFTAFYDGYVFSSAVKIHKIILLLTASILVINADAAEKPNVLFIAIDDLNDYISPLDNHPGVKTPNFERLAKRSMNFTNAHCAAPACHPSRVAVMTGVHPVRSGIYRNLFGAHGPRWRDESPVLKDAVVMSKHFRDNGYRAVGGGKIFHTLQWTKGDSQNDPEAWDDYFIDALDPISSIWPRPELVPDAKKGIGPGRPLGYQLFGAAPLDVPDEETGDHIVADWAIGELATPQEKPLFLAVGLFRPHIPWEVPQKWFDMYPPEDIKLPAHLVDDLKDAHSHGREGWHQWVTDNKQWEHFMRGYLASISYVDHQLGRILDALNASPMKDNTIVVLWTDHGFHIGEKENWEKFALWDQTTHVPVFIHAPGVSKDGEKTDQPATLTDLYPTLCELTGISIPEQCDGKSLVPQLKDPTTPREPALTSYAFTAKAAASHALCDSRYRYIKYDDGTEELYDLEKDPNEFTNIAGNLEMAKVKARLAKFLPKDPAPNRGVPNRGVPKDSKYNRKKPPQEDIANKPLRIQLSVTPVIGKPDGVLFSQGGEVNGVAVYVKNGRPYFGIRRNSKWSMIAHSEVVPEEPFTLTAQLGKGSAASLTLNGREIARGKLSGLVPRTPNEGRVIGADSESAVGEYEVPFRYAGKVSAGKRIVAE